MPGTLHQISEHEKMAVLLFCLPNTMQISLVDTSNPETHMQENSGNQFQFSKADIVPSHHIGT